MLFPLLLKPKLFSMKNRWHASHRSRSSRARDLIIILFALFTMGGIYTGVSRMLSYAHQNTHLAYLPPALPLGTLFMFLLAMLMLSSMVTGFGSLFLARDLDLVLSAPVSWGRFYLGKISEVFLNSSWMALLFGIPAIAAFGVSYRAPWEFYLITFVVLIPYFAIPAALAIIAAVFFTRFGSTHRTREFLLFAAGLVLFAFYKLLRLIAPAGGSMRTINDMLELLAAVSKPHTVFAPSYWVAQALGAFLEPARRDPTPYIILLYGAAATLTAFGYIAVRILYFDAYSYSRSIRQRKSFDSRRRHLLFRRLFAFVPQQSRALFGKEISGITRDITQVVQVVMLSGIAFLYLYNVKVLQNIESIPIQERAWWQGFLMVLNLAMGAFIITAACTRFVFPSLSLEGPSYWILQTSPITLRQLLRVKFWCWLVPISLATGFIFAAGALALKAEAIVVLLNVLSSFAICYGIVGVAIGLGAAFANFDWEHSSQLAASFGSLVFMLVSTMLITVNVVPTSILLFARSHFSPERWMLLMLGDLVFVYLLNLRVAHFCLSSGERALLKKSE